MVLRLAGNVGVDVAIELEPARDSCLHQRFERAEDGRSPDTGLLWPEMLIQLVRGELSAGSGQGVGDQQSLTGHAFAGSGKPLSCRERRSIHATTLAQPRLRIM